MLIIRPKLSPLSRYATLNREHYICPECRIHIVRDRDEDMFLCLKCGRKETRAEFRQTLLDNIATAQEGYRERRRHQARIDRYNRHAKTPQGKEELSFVYYIRFAGRIKIGTTVNLRARLSNLPWDEVLLTEPGGRTKERERHHQFKDSRQQGEWFKESPALLTFITKRREEIEEHNAAWFGERPPFPWMRDEVDIPGSCIVAANVGGIIDAGEAIQVDEIDNGYGTVPASDYVRGI